MPGELILIIIQTRAVTKRRERESNAAKCRDDTETEPPERRHTLLSSVATSCQPCLRYPEQGLSLPMRHW